MKLFPQLSALLSIGLHVIKFFHQILCFWHSVYIIMKYISTALCATDVLHMWLWSSLNNSLCYWHPVPFIMKLLPQLTVLLALCTYLYEIPSTTLCLLTFCTCHYKALSTYLCAINIPCLSLWSSFHISLCYRQSVHIIINFFHSSVCYWHTVPLFMKFLPYLWVLLTFCTCLYEDLSTALFTTDTLFLS